MAYHYRESGHTKLVIGWIYSHSLSFLCYRFKLKKYNKETGMCFLVSETSGTSFYVSANELSHWYRVGTGVV